MICRICINLIYLKLYLFVTNKKNRSRNFLIFLIQISLSFQHAVENPDAPSNLRCYDKINPIGIADNSYFAWFTSDPDDNEIQSAYQIIVSSSKEKPDSNIGDIWDREKVSSRK